MSPFFSPIKILEKNSDVKTQQIFEAVIVLLKNCKDGAVERIFRWKINIVIYITLGTSQVVYLLLTLSVIMCESSEMFLN